MKARRLVWATFLWPAFSCIVMVAWSQEEDKSKNSNANLSDYQSLDSIFSRIEQDLKTAEGGDRIGNIQEALKRLANAYESKAKSGDRESQFKIGAMYLEGLGVHAKYGEAARWFSLAGGSDHPLAQLAHGLFYLKCRDDDTRDRQIRARAIEALGKIGPAAESSIPLLQQELGNDWPLGNAAAIALGRMGGPGVAVLIESLTSKEVAVRRVAIEGLAHAGEAARPAAAKLTAALQDEDATVRQLAQELLERLRSLKEQK